MRLRLHFHNPLTAALLPCAAMLIAFVGCAPERVLITDADDLAKFAAASRASAEKRVAERKAADQNVTAQKAVTPADTRKKASGSKLDETSQALFDRMFKDQGLGAEERSELEEAFANLPPQMRAIWVAQQEAKANQGKRPIASPRELPPTVKAEPISRKSNEIQQADYREPVVQPENENTLGSPRQSPSANSLSFKGEELLTAIQANTLEVARLREEQQKLAAAQANREQQQAGQDQKEMLLELLQKHGGLKANATDDDISGMLGGASTGFGQPELLSAMMKSKANLSSKKAPLPDDSIASDLPKSAATTAPTVPGPKIEEIWNQMVGDVGSDPSLSLALRRRFLQFAAGDVDAASIPPDEFTASEKEGWKHMMRAFEMMVKQGDNPRRDRQAALITREIREAISEFEAGSVLDLQNAAFCSSVQAFGNYVEFESTTFKPDDEVILYVELQNFASRERADGKAFETEFQGAYQILDSSGKRVADHDLPVEHGVCRQRRRDYFLAYRIHVPKNVPEGPFTLQLTLEDKISGKFGQTTVKFAIQK